MCRGCGAGGGYQGQESSCGECVLLLPATLCRQISVWFAVLQVQVKDSVQGANSSFTS